MNDIMHIRNSSYSRYEELLMIRDNLQKEAFQWDREYIRIFGDKILKIFELKLECIRKKKTISFCQMAANRGGNVNQDELQQYLEAEMALYQQQLEDMIEENQSVKDSKKVSELDLLEIKKVYRRLAKQLHPDINPQTVENEKLMELWDRISVAYRCNNLKDMRELEILAAAAIKAMGEEKWEIEITDIDEKIAEVEAEIDNIRNTDPYMYKFILEDEDAVHMKNAALDEEYTSYVEYGKQLDEILQGLMINGVTFTWRMN